MASYILSNENRVYTAAEAVFGEVAPVTAQGAVPLVRLQVQERDREPKRRDKTGSRSFGGYGTGLRRVTAFQLDTYHTGVEVPGQEPACGALVGSAFGGPVKVYNGGTLASAPSGSTIEFSGAHGLSVGQGVVSGSEIRFVAAVPDSTRVVLNAPFAGGGGVATGGTWSCSPGAWLPSASVFDYWSPVSAVQRILRGATVDRFEAEINGDYHEFRFRGFAAELLDSISFVPGQGGLSSFPQEPTGRRTPLLVPGHLGQVWLGISPARAYTITGAKVVVENAIDPRDREYGSNIPRAFVPGERRVTLQLSMYETDEGAVQDLFRASRERSPISVMLQLGEQPGQLCGLYLPRVVPEVPEFVDSDIRLEWSFSASRAQGEADDEIFIAFG